MLLSRHRESKKLLHCHCREFSSDSFWDKQQFLITITNLLDFVAK